MRHLGKFLRESAAMRMAHGVAASSLVFCVLSAAGGTIRSKSDLRLWQAVHDRAAPLEWPWEAGADAATLTFSNRVTRAVSALTVQRREGEARGGVAQPVPQPGEEVVDVTLVQSAGGREVAREAATLAYVAGAGGGPVTVQANPGARTWTRVRAPRVYAVDPAWRGEAGESGYDIAWPEYTGLKLFLR